MCTKEQFTARIAQGLADRKAEREAREIEERERRGREYGMYVSNKMIRNPRNKGIKQKALGNYGFQT